ncbi:PLAC8-domain-containing protein [Schizopora paradoxa]|uniref:PLAC8-domain-containing protein n=1 Tax=Schizopora paradoxa TaxID=27342 RepID=A0A0H2RWZ7_9AGAM|nr:PLAC8-domain-containing protein [Schizopora paradoxa]
MHSSSPPITTYEPKATMPMVADIKNVLQKPKFPNGERVWSYGMCDCCCEHFGTCTWCFACWCPCIVYAKLQSRLSFLERNNYPHPDGGNGCTSECFIHGCLTSLCGVGWALQIGQRSAIRDRYRISGNGCGDCMGALCCTPCTLTQESREVALEERVLGGNERTIRLD